MANGLLSPILGWPLYHPICPWEIDVIWVTDVNNVETLPEEDQIAVHYVDALVSTTLYFPAEYMRPCGAMTSLEGC